MRTLLRFARSLYRNTAGNTLAIGAAAFFPLLAMIGGAIDLSVAYLAKSQMQNACDSAVLAGRQSMTGTRFTGKDRVEANKFFNFNFPDGRLGARNLKFSIGQNTDNLVELVGHASAAIPTSLMRVFGYETIAVAVTCNATREPLNNDIMLVLDVTGSMGDPAFGLSSRSKIASLRSGALGIYRGIGDSPTAWTRFGIVPYSITVNVAHLLQDDDILRDQEYFDDLCPNGRQRNCFDTKTVNITDSTWGDGSGDELANLTAFRDSGAGCIEERPSLGMAGQAIQFADTITDDDIDERATGQFDTALQFGRYDPTAHENSGLYYNYEWLLRTYGGEVKIACPSEAQTLRHYPSESGFAAAIGAATAKVEGNTYHDIGMLWGLRLISRTGFFASENPETIGSSPVQQHIVFLTDGARDTRPNAYSAYGVNMLQGRVAPRSTQKIELDDIHSRRFLSACNLAKSRGITVWVIALAVSNTTGIKPCATSANHFYVSDGSDLEQIFEDIGKNINKLRLSK